MDIDLHPADHAPGSLPRTEFDAVVLGGGSTGENVAARAASGGLDVLIVENQLLGGDCSYWACMPSKALLRSPQALEAARAVAGARQAVGGEVDVAAVLERRDSFTSHWKDDGQVSWAESAGLTVVRGTGRLLGERTVEITGHDGDRRTVRARHAVAICTGSRASLPPIPGLAGAAPWTPREGTSAQHPPERLVVIGGGVAGVELASAWSALGVRVDLLVRGDRVLGRLEPAAGLLVQQALEKRGVTVHLQTEARRVSREDGAIAVEVDDHTTLRTDALLVAAGRRPRTDGIGLDSVGLADGEYVETDDSMQVSGVQGGWLFAAGDCTGRALLTHMGKYQARICGDVIAARAAGGSLRGDDWAPHRATADHAAVPQVVFTNPQVAAVGLTEQQARGGGLRVRSVDFDMADVSGVSLHTDDPVGWARLVVDEDRRVVVGATFVGPQVEDLLHSATVAVVGEVPLDRLWHAVPAYPTPSEVWLRLLESYGL